MRPERNERARRWRTAAGGLALAVLLASCNLLAPAGSTGESRLNLGRDGQRVVKVAGRTLVLRTADGKALGDFKVFVAGKAYVMKDGQLSVPDAALKDLAKGGGPIVLAPGYVPRQIGPGVLGGEAALELVPIGAASSPIAVARAGGSVAGPGGLTVDFSAGVLTRPSTNVTVGTYVPPTPDAAGGPAADAIRAERAKLVELVGSGGAGGTGGTCDAPLPCVPPLAGGIGLMLTADQPLAAGQQLTGGFDLVAMSAPPAGADAVSTRHAAAAKTVLDTFRRIDATGNPAWRQTLESAYGITFDGRTLRYRITLGAGVATDGFTQVDVEGFDLLGARLEVTVHSATKPDGFKIPEGPGETGGTGGMGGTAGTSGIGELMAPPPLPGGLPRSFTVGPPVPLITNNGGNVVANQGAKLIGDYGAGLIGDYGAGIVSNNGGGLIGQVRYPFRPDEGGGSTAKYVMPGFSLLQVACPPAYAEWPAAGLPVRAMDWAGTGFGPTSTSDAAGNYALPNLPSSPTTFFVMASSGEGELLTLTEAPGAVPPQTAVKSLSRDLDAASTAIAKWTLFHLRNGWVHHSEVDPAGFAADVAWIRCVLTPGQAADVVRLGPDQAGPLVGRIIEASGRLPLAISSVMTLAGEIGGYLDGTGRAARFGGSAGHLVADAAGNLYVSDRLNHAIRKIDPAGVVTTLAGNGTPGFADGAGAAARFDNPLGIALDGSGNLIVADTSAHLIRRVTPTGVVTTLAGTPGSEGSADGPAGTHRLNTPMGLAIGPDGTIYFTEYYGHRVRKLDPSGAVTTIAGNGTPDFIDGTGANARFFTPTDLVREPSGDLLVADRYNHRIRRVTPAGVVTTFAGTGEPGADDGPAATARFNAPLGLERDPAGNVYVADELNLQIRRIDPTGNVTTLMGNGTYGTAEGGYRRVQFRQPVDVALLPDGRLAMMDTLPVLASNGTVRVLATNRRVP